MPRTPRRAVVVVTSTTEARSPTQFRVDGRDFEGAADVIRYLVDGHTKKELVELVVELSAVETLDVERLAEAGGNVLDGRRIGSVRLYRNTITPDDWQAIAAEYARLAFDSTPEQEPSE
jgi:hypothetical protein